MIKVDVDFACSEERVVEGSQMKLRKIHRCAGRGKEKKVKQLHSRVYADFGRGGKKFDTIITGICP